MPHTSNGLILSDRRIDPWVVPSLELGASNSTLCLPVFGYIGNSITTSLTGKLRTSAWKVLVASKVKAQRGVEKWSPKADFAITLGFSFYLGQHGGRFLDVENFLKPALDALAAGLFCPNDLDPAAIEKWGYDDSHFNTLLVHRLDDALDARSEGMALIVSSQQ